MSDKNIAETVEELTAAGFTERVVQGVPYVLVPEGYTYLSLESLLPGPKLLKQVINLISLESFTRYVNQFKTDATRITVAAGGGARAVIDAHAKDSPAWEAHFATFLVTYSDRWRIWDSNSKQAKSQKQFAEFVEDNIADFFAPKGAAMLDISKTLQAEQNSTFKSGIRLENGDVQLNYEKTTVSKAGQKGEMEIPSQFTILIPILEGEPPREIEVRLRYGLDEGRLTLTFEVLRKAALLEEVRRSIYATIKNDTGIEPLLVA